MNKVFAGVAGIAVGLGAIWAVITTTIDTVSAVQTDKEAEVWRSGHELTEAEKFKVDRIDRVQLLPSFNQGLKRLG